MKRVIGIALILVVVAGVSLAGYQFLNPKPYRITEDPNVEVVNIKRDTILATVNASGRIEPKTEVQVNFETSGVVAQVPVERGQRVTAGTLLARLQTADLELAVKTAQVDLARTQAELKKLYEPAAAQDLVSAQAAVDSARSNLDHVLAGPTPEEIASGRAAVQSAQANLDKVLAGPSQDDITAAAADVRRTQLALKQAQWDYDQVSYRGDIGAMPQASQLEQATIDFETARAKYNVAIKGPTQADVSAARSQLAEAQSNLAKLLASPTAADKAAAQSQLAEAEASLAKLHQGPADADVAVAQATIDAAQLKLQQAQLNLAKASLVAPIDGTVTQVNVKPGEQPGTGQAAVVLADMSAYHIDVEIDEIDIGRLALGQKATIAIDAIPDATFAGHVSAISPGPIQGTSSGIVAYEVTVALDDADSRLLPGMTTDATIETQRLENVLVIPNRAVGIDRTSGNPVPYVEKVNKLGDPARVQIELGLRNETVSQVVKGLDEGDQIVVSGQSRLQQLQQVFQGGPGD
jgi:HlyD family secretion protein